MKGPWKSVLLATCALFALALVFAGCGSGDEVSAEDQLTGNWTSTDGQILLDFRPGNVLVATINGQLTQFSYQAEDGKLTLSHPDLGEETTVDYSIQNDRLTIGAGLIPGESVTFTKSS